MHMWYVVQGAHFYWDTNWNGGLTRFGLVKHHMCANSFAHNSGKCRFRPK